MNKAAVLQGDETTWRVQQAGEQGRKSRAWLWTALTVDAVFFQVDASRSADAAMILSGACAHGAILVQAKRRCDRYSAYHNFCLFSQRPSNPAPV